MEINRITLPPIAAAGEVTTFYSFESGTARSVALSNLAVLLAGRKNATVPVLMIDWDTESPGLHHYFDQHDEHDGLLEYFQACREQLAMLGCETGVDDAALAQRVLDAIDWEPYVSRVDQSRPLYLMRAGRFDDSYGERADKMDWDGLFAACPALFRCFGEHMARRFQHVLVDARSGRSAAVSVCTTLLPRKLVALFTPNQRSLDGLAGVVGRAVDYRCSHEEEQRPLLVYPLPCSIDSADCERRIQWRRGDPYKGLAGYQPALEQLFRTTYGLSQVSLDSYLDEVQLQQTSAMASGERLAAWPERDADRFSLARTFDTLLDWLAQGYFPWQSHAEVALLGAIAAARALSAEHVSAAVSVPLARDLNKLGELYRKQGRMQQALACFEEATELRRRLLGDDHADTRASRASLAESMRLAGRLDDAKYQYEFQLHDCMRLLGPDHPDTLAARAGLAATLAQMTDFVAALDLYDEVIERFVRLLGAGHALTLESQFGKARALSLQGDLERAHAFYEMVLFGRETLLGTEHADTLRCSQELAGVLCEMGKLNNARKIQEGVVRAREKHAGPDHPDTLQAREALAEILAAQDDLPAVRRMQEGLAKARERRLGSEHPETLSIQLRLAATLGRQGELEEARRLQQHVVTLQERIRGVDDLETLSSKKLLAATLSRQGHSVAAHRLEESVLQASDRLLGSRGMPSGPHDARAGVLRLKQSVLDARASGAQPDTLEQKLAELRHLIDSCHLREARALADSLRKPLLRPDVPQLLRQRGVDMIRQVYQQDGDKDAQLAFTEDVVASLEVTLTVATGGRPGGAYPVEAG